MKTSPCDLVLPDASLPWQMTFCERFALVGALEKLRPELSLEVGTYHGGSLQILSRLSREVISVDINPDVASTLKDKFTNVQFECGDSTEVLPRLIAEINAGNRPLEFVLIDGDHSAEGVKRDIEAALQIVPKKQIVIVLHDSFNPECREGMRSAAWSLCPYVHYVELDFIPGVYHANAFDTAGARSMWGGLAIAILKPVERTDHLVVLESQKGLFDAVHPVSVHWKSTQPVVAVSWLRRAFGLFKSLKG